VRLKDRAPHVVVENDGVEKWHVEDRTAPNIGLSTMAGRSPEEFTVKAQNFKDMRPGCYDPKERVKDMDLDGVKVSCCFPAVPGLGGEGFLNIKDAELRHWAISAYNDYVVEEFQPTAPGRLIGLGILPLTEPELAVGELQRIAKRGIKGVTIPFWITGSVQGAKPLVHSMYDPVWSACEDLGIPINLHIGGNPRGGGLDDLTAGVPGMAEAFITAAPLTNFEVLSQLIWTGMLHRHPRLKVISSEGGIGWIPYLLERADYTYNKHRFWTRSVLPQLPSTYFKRQCYACFIYDEAGVQTRHLIGVDNLMWESDYPHTDTTWPFSHDRINDSLKGVPEDERRKIVYSNLARVYGLE
jgi:predicted TIM-barrel fold metal-dependent hydrolase